MSDIIEKLREYAQHAETRSERDTFEATINEITSLREENARLREALKPFAEAFESDYAEQEEDHWDLWESAAASILTYGHLRAAAAAILGKIKDEAACPEPDEAP